LFVFGERLFCQSGVWKKQASSGAASSYESFIAGKVGATATYCFSGNTRYRYALTSATSINIYRVNGNCSSTGFVDQGIFATWDGNYRNFWSSGSGIVHVTDRGFLLFNSSGVFTRLIAWD